MKVNNRNCILPPFSVKIKFENGALQEANFGFRKLTTALKSWFFALSCDIHIHLYFGNFRFLLTREMKTKAQFTDSSKDSVSSKK